VAARSLSIYLGREAARRIARDGWSPDLFDLLLGASGGPKWFVLGQLDRVLFGRFLAWRSRSLSVLGSSIGAWRHACLALPDPVAAVEQLERGYLYQHYRQKPTAAEVSQVSRELLQQVLGRDGAAALVANPRIHTHIVTARGRGPAGSTATPLLATALGVAALGNTVSRHLLKPHFQRVVFHSREVPDPGVHLPGFDTRYCALGEESVARALHASGAIPFVLTGERDIPGAPAGQYWDGGIIDYHFDLGQYRGDGLILYPHFSATVVPGWFDKFLPWRRAAIEEAEHLVLLCPSEDFTASLPHGKIPDRSDFSRFTHEARVAYWEECVRRSQALAEEFTELLEGGDPLRGAVVFG